MATMHVDVGSKRVNLTASICFPDCPHADLAEGHHPHGTREIAQLVSSDIRKTILTMDGTASQPPTLWNIAWIGVCSIGWEKAFHGSPVPSAARRVRGSSQPGHLGAGPPLALRL